RRFYPKAKIVVYFTDLIKINNMRFSNAPIDINYLKSLSDLILTYDPEEACHFGLTYYPVPLSRIENISDVKEVWDVYFIGQAKNRLPLIMQTYHALSKKGLKVNFIISGVPKNNQENLPGITYINGISLSYKENIRTVLRSKCLLEIIQKNSTGDTIRTKEALVYNKKLLTNNPLIVNAPFYNPEYICYFENPDDINPEFIKGLAKDEVVDYHYKDQLSPLRLLEFIENHLNNEDKKK
ncbi:MAG: hypothetical protein K2K64_10825, partial [Muribaculaceae bacterium]|nr:hypothetical protein [Muribaculaceae bacterium]